MPTSVNSNSVLVCLLLHG